jgi:hypothetical protein
MTTATEIRTDFVVRPIAPEFVHARAMEYGCFVLEVRRAEAEEI